VASNGFGIVPEQRRFDFVLIYGEKQGRRLLESKLIRPGDNGFQGYPEFELVVQMAAKPPQFFDNDRPTILYNPHFEPKLSSWPLVGMEERDFFARSTRYNLIFAPHLQLFHPLNFKKYAPFHRVVVPVQSLTGCMQSSS